MIIIAEFCQNHNGDFELLKEMLYAAKESGADYAKIQTIFADMLSYRERFETGIVKNGIEMAIKRPYKDEYERLKKLELSMERQAEFVELCKSIDIKPLTTVFTRDSISLIKTAGFEEIKIASYDCSSMPLLKDVKESFNKIFVSTGATNDDEIEAASKLLDGSDFSFLHCVSQYPTPLNEYHLSRMNYLGTLCNKVGWSDHSLVERDGIFGTLASIYYGAEIIERHFTILPANKTKDGPVSIRPEHVVELKQFSELSKEEMREILKNTFPNYQSTLGNAKRALSEIELKNRDYYRTRFASKMSNGNTYYNWEYI
jgi:N,N'-diacetyllegionaminate synthase